MMYLGLLEILLIFAFIAISMDKQKQIKSLTADKEEYRQLYLDRMENVKGLRESEKDLKEEVLILRREIDVYKMHINKFEKTKDIEVSSKPSNKDYLIIDI